MVVSLVNILAHMLSVIVIVGGGDLGGGDFGGGDVWWW